MVAKKRWGGQRQEVQPTGIRRAGRACAGLCGSARARVHVCVCVCGERVGKPWMLVQGQHRITHRPLPAHEYAAADVVERGFRFVVHTPHITQAHPTAALTPSHPTFTHAQGRPRSKHGGGTRGPPSSPSHPAAADGACVRALPPLPASPHHPNPTPH